MPKGIGYAEAGRASKVGVFSKIKKSIKKRTDAVKAKDRARIKKKINKKSESVIIGMMKTGLSRKEAEKRLDKGAR